MDVWQYQADWQFPDDGVTIQFYWTDDLLPDLPDSVDEWEYVLLDTPDPETLRFEWSADLQFEETQFLADDFHFAPDLAAVDLQGSEYDHELYAVLDELLEDGDAAYPDDGAAIPTWTFEFDPPDLFAEINEDEWRYVLVVTPDDVLPFESQDEVEPEAVAYLDEDFWPVGEEPSVVAVQGYVWADGELQCVEPDFSEEWESRSIAESVAAGTWNGMGAPRQYLAAENVNLVFALEVHMRATAGRVNARLYDLTAAVPVVSSEVYTESSVMEYRTSPPLSLVDGHWYQAQTARSAGGTGEIDRAAAVVV